MTDILIDTRQQKGKHENIDRWFDAHGVTYEYRALNFGDYMRADGSSNVSIDTKRSIGEVAMDCGRDHDRFTREMDRAREAGYRLVILVEVGGPYKELKDLNQWISYGCRNRCDRWRYHTCDPLVSTSCTRFKRKPLQGPALARIVSRLEHNHGCRFEFCHPAQSARRICELLGVSWE